jgi:hypothetical protein
LLDKFENEKIYLGDLLSLITLKHKKGEYKWLKEKLLEKYNINNDEILKIGDLVENRKEYRILKEENIVKEIYFIAEIVKIYEDKCDIQIKYYEKNGVKIESEIDKTHTNIELQYLVKK